MVEVYNVAGSLLITMEEEGFVAWEGLRSISGDTVADEPLTDNGI